jgi:SAM-dependent methyltransferase
MKLCPSCNLTNVAEDWRCLACGHTPLVIEGYPAFAPEYAREGGGFKPEYFAELARLEAGSFWFRSRNRLIIWALQHYFPKAESFLEIGCGTAFVLSGIAQAFPDMRLAGSEIFSQGLAFAAERLPVAELMQMDARRIPYQEEFDVIGAFDVLEHIVEDENVLQEINKALKPAGGMLLTVPQHQFLWSAADESAHHVRRYSARDLREKVERAGFKVLRMTSFVSLLLPLMLASRWSKGRTKTEQGSAELSLASSVDVLLEYVMRVEISLIRSGLKFPSGGSLLLIAKKM